MGLPEVRLNARIVVLARAPWPGRCKTRLIPALGAQGAARLARALIEHTLRVVEQSGLPWSLALDGRPDAALTASLRRRSAPLLQQPAGDLGARLRWASQLAPRTICIGTDCPGLQQEDLRQAAEAPEPCLGPAEDGGYYLIAVDGNDHDMLNMAFEGIPWSTDQVFEQTRRKLTLAGRPPRLLPTRADLDTPSDLARLRSDPACPPSLLPLLGGPASAAAPLES